jgi:DNA-binding transcriptional ArsR family regulator
LQADDRLHQRVPLIDGIATVMIRASVHEPGLTSVRAHGSLHRLVNYRAPDLDVVFASLSDPTRRAILARLAREGSVSISDLAEPFSIKLPAVMKHLDVLGNAGLITRSKQGRTVQVRLSPAPLRGATEWLRRYERFWSPALDRLVAHVERKEAEVRAAEAKAKAR